jgi:putative flippase GtrA
VLHRAPSARPTRAQDQLVQREGADSIGFVDDYPIQALAGLNFESSRENSINASIYRALGVIGQRCGRPNPAAELALSYRELPPGPAVALIARLPKGLLKFLVVGAAALAVHTATFTAVLQFGANKSVAWLAGLVTSTLVAWSLNRKHTFSGSGRSQREEISRYALVTLVAQGISFAVFHLASRAAPNIWPQACLLAGAAVATLFSYSGQRFFTFAPQRLAGHGA